MELIFLSRGSLKYKDHALITSDFELIVDLVVNQKSNFTLNKEKINSIMQDVAVIADYVDNLQGSYDAKSIKAIDNGTLVKNGNKWMINKKIKVKLIKK